jgi:hypothetical protein
MVAWTTMASLNELKYNACMWRVHIHQGLVHVSSAQFGILKEFEFGMELAPLPRALEHGRLKSINDQCMESRYPEHPGTSRDIPDFNRLYTSNVVNPFHWFPLTGLSSSPRSFRTWQGGHTEETFDEIANALCIVVLCNLSIQDRHRNLMKFANFALYVESSFDHHLAASWSGRLISGQGSQSLHSASAQDRA